MSDSTPLSLTDIARLPAPDDNVAVATRRIEKGSVVRMPGNSEHRIRHTILIGHRLAIRAIAKGEELLSWGLPFGRALHPIPPGEYVCNALTLQALAQRNLPGVVLPDAPNFEEAQRPFVFDRARFAPSPPVPPAPDPRTFRGFRRPGRRGVGTRNTVAIIGTSSRTGALARVLAARLQPLAAQAENIDGIVAVAHTEGGGPEEPNNRAEVLRALAGFVVHPNIGAVLLIDHGSEPVNNTAVESYLRTAGHPLDAVPHAFLSSGRNPAAAIERGERIVREWLPMVAAGVRADAPLSELKIALQCGGSDAFSGISANPFAAQVAREAIRHGACVNQAETDELIGAESYFLQHVRSAELVERFLETQERFKERLSWHGVSAEGNPSGGNRLRGLYNIVLKSLGAAVKKAPDVRLDWVIDYAERIPGPGFTFMDSPGNDLESIGGQVASGCNLILFTTGNGSITNFPFVPTIKFMSTTIRHELLENEMDVNAGAYLDGVPMEQLAARGFDLAIEVAGGRRTRGEAAGHSQVSIWRNWSQTRPAAWQPIATRPAPDGQPLPVRPPRKPLNCGLLTGWAAPDGRFACDRIGLIMPASLCATQIARLAAERMNATNLADRLHLSRFVALVHSEGCGFSSKRLYRQLGRTYAGYAGHPCAALTLFLEHGCEKVPNDVIRSHLTEAGLSPDRFGWASVQLDGGIENVIARIKEWFESNVSAVPPQGNESTGGRALSVGVLTAGPVETSTAATLSELVRGLIAGGATIFIPASSSLLANADFSAAVLETEPVQATLEWGQRPAAPGLHVVATESAHWSENLAGLGACGAQLFVGITDGSSHPGHPMLPLLQIAESPLKGLSAPPGHDACLTGNAAADVARLLDLLAAAANRTHEPACQALGNAEFQITRGLLGVST